jgi:cystathionine beta-lyase
MMIVDGQSLSKLRTRTSEKWSGSAEDVLPMPVAEMDFEIDQSIKDRLNALIDNSDTGYLGSTKELEANLSSFAKTRWGWDIDPEFIYTCGDVSVGKDARDGCSVVRTVNYNVKDLSQYCSIIESIP